MNEKFLPIGTRVVLNNGTKRAIIIGYFPVDLNLESKVADYCACLYPEGVLDTSKNISFNHSDIARVEVLGYKDKEFEEWNKALHNNN